MESSEEFVEFIKDKFAPIIIFNIDESLNDPTSENGDIWKLILDINRKLRSKNVHFRPMKFDDFLHSQDDVSFTDIKKNIKEMSKIFYDPDFTCNFKINVTPEMKEKCPYFPDTQYFTPHTALTQHTPWFLWFRNFLFDQFSVHPGFLTEVPIMNIYVTHPNNFDKALEEYNAFKSYKSHQVDFPNIFLQKPSSSDNHKLINKYINTVFLLVAGRSDEKECGQIFKQYANKLQSLQICDKEILEVFMQELIKNGCEAYFKTQMDELKNLVQPEPGKKKSIFSSKPTPIDKLRLATFFFQDEQYEEAQKIFSSFSLASIKNLYSYTHFMDLLCSFIVGEKKGAFPTDKLLQICNYQDNSIIFSIMRILCALSFSECKKYSPRDMHICNKYCEEALNNIKSSVKLYYFIRALLSEENAICNTRCGQMDRISTLNIFNAAQYYSLIKIRGLSILYYAFAQSAIYDILDQKKYFVAGRVQNTEDILQIPVEWHDIGYCTLHKLSEELYNTKNYNIAMKIIIMLLASTPCKLVSDDGIFPYIHPCYHNYLDEIKRKNEALKQMNDDAEPLKAELKLVDVPLVIVDPSRTKFTKYGTFEHFGYDRSKFDKLLEVQRRQFKQVTGTNALSYMWGVVKNTVQNAVCGEPITVSLPVRNRRWADIFIEGIHLNGEGSEFKVSLNDKGAIPASKEEIIPLQITPLKPGNIKITGFSFVYWGIIEDTIKINPIDFVVTNEHPSIKTQFIGTTPSLIYCDQVEFVYRIENFGDSPANEVFILSDNISSFCISEDCTIMQGHRITQVIKPDDPLMPSSYRDIKFTVNANIVGKLEIKMLCVFKGPKESGFRSIPDIIEFDVKEREKAVFEFTDHPLAIDKLLLCAEIQTKESGCKVTGIEVLSKKVNNFVQVSIPPNSSYFYVLELETSEEVCSQSEFIKCNDSVGFLSLETDDGHKQFHIIKKDNSHKFDVRYSVNTPSEINFEEGLTIPIEFIIKNCGTTDFEDLFISPVQTTKKTTAETKATNIVWVGCTKKRCKLIKAGEEKKFTFNISLITPGIYNVSNFTIQGSTFSQTIDLSHVIFVK